MGVFRLAAQPRGIWVELLTPYLAKRLKAEAAEALNGDGTCSLHAMTTSCFASENCAKGHSAMQLDMLLSHPFAFVVLADVEPDGATPIASERFVGCVSAAPAADNSMCPRLFPRQQFRPDADLVLFNLCIADAYRGHGLGRRLVQRILDCAKNRSSNPRTYLLVARTGETHTDPAVTAAFASRVPRLQKTYDRLGFRSVDTCDVAHLMCFDG